MSSNQPLTMMTINDESQIGKSNDNLLTLRMLEVSERKLQLLKKLLTREQYESIASDLFSLDFSIQHQSAPAEQPAKDEHQTDSTTSFEQRQNSGQETPESISNFQEILANRREAVQFFFQQPEEDLKTSQQLSIVLRSGYRQVPAGEDALKILKNLSFSIFDRLAAILSLLGVTNLQQNPVQDQSKFVRPHQKVDWETFSREKNLQPVSGDPNKNAEVANLVKLAAEQTSGSGWKQLEEDNPAAEMSTRFNLRLNCIDFQVHPLMLDEEKTAILVEDSKDESEILQTGKDLDDEQERKDAIRKAMQDLSLNLKLDDQYLHQCKLDWSENHLFQLDLSQNGQIPLPVGEKTEAKLRFELLSKDATLIADSEAQISLLEPKMHLLVLNGVNFSARLQFELQSISAKPEEEQLIQEVFQSAPQFDDRDTKLSNLINPLDLRYILHFLAQQQDANCIASDPFETKFELDSETRLRHSLLTWRWMNSIQQPVYLSERENTVSFRLRTDELRLRLQSVSLKPETGYRLIEQVGFKAVEHIRNFEAQVDEALRLQESCQSKPSSRGRDLLHEPSIKLNLSAIAKSSAKLIPRRTTRRPLMAQRNKRPVKSALLNSAPKTIDLEAQTLITPINSRDQSGEMQLVVTVQHATDVPMRIVQQSVADRVASPIVRSSSPFAPPMMMPINFLMHPTTYIELIFQRQQRATSLAQGQNPVWNETLFMPVDFNSRQASELFAHQKKQTCDSISDSSLQLNLYDYHCYLEDADNLQTYPSLEQQTLSTLQVASSPLPVDSTLVNSNKLLSSRQRIERHLLGSLRIPLATLLANSRIEGSFALNQPLLLDNYQFQPELNLPEARLAPRLGSSKESSPSSNSRRATRINLFITLDPPMFAPHPQLYLKVGSHESQSMMDYIRLWEQIASKLQAQFELRAKSSQFKQTRSMHYSSPKHLKCLVVQKEAKYCLICRLLGPLQPPLAELGLSADSKLERKMKTLARFVSLLNPVKYGVVEMPLLASSLWFDSVQLVNQRLGGLEEKAVLLCNYFLHLGCCSAILLADAIPAGRSVFVIVWRDNSRFVEDPQELRVENLQTSSPVSGQDFISRLSQMDNFKVELWDPSSARRFSIQSEESKLTSIGCIVSMENVYANLQPLERIAETRFELSNTNCWLPLFQDPSGGSKWQHLQRTRKSGLRMQLSRLEEMRKSLGRPSIVPLVSSKSQISYQQFSVEQCEQLRDHIERAIKSSLFKWRPNRATYFNRTLSRLISDQLASCESWLEDDNEDTKEEDWRSKLAETIRGEVLVANLACARSGHSRQVVSWPINLSYTSVESIVDLLYASGVHNADFILDWPNRQEALASSNTQFLVGCHVRSYPARLMSVWLYVAAVLSKSRGILLT